MRNKKPKPPIERDEDGRLGSLFEGGGPSIPETFGQLFVLVVLFLIIAVARNETAEYLPGLHWTAGFAYAAFCLVCPWRNARLGRSAAAGRALAIMLAGWGPWFAFGVAVDRVEDAPLRLGLLVVWSIASSIVAWFQPVTGGRWLTAAFVVPGLVLGLVGLFML